MRAIKTLEKMGHKVNHNGFQFSVDFPNNMELTFHAGSSFSVGRKNAEPASCEYFKSLNKALACLG